MGITAFVTSSQPVGETVAVSGGLVVVASLIYLLTYLDLLDASRLDRPDLRIALIASLIPLAIAFVGVLVFNIIQLVGLPIP